jgi:hypothetical protein
MVSGAFAGTDNGQPVEAFAPAAVNNIAIANSAGKVRVLKCFFTVSIGFMGSNWLPR